MGKKKFSPIINSMSARECIIKITFIPRLISTRLHFNGTLIRVLERYLMSSMKKLRADSVSNPNFLPRVPKSCSKNASANERRRAGKLGTSYTRKEDLDSRASGDT